MERPFHVEVLSGVATPVGLLGLRGEASLGDLLALGAGLGTNGLGLEWEAHARLRVIHGVHRQRRMYNALTLEGAFSRGRYQGVFEVDPGLDCNQLDPRGGCYDPPLVAQTVNWGQAELGWEAMFESGFTVRIASGLARQIGMYQWQCHDGDQLVPCGEHSAPSNSLFVFSFALGYAF